MRLVGCTIGLLLISGLAGMVLAGSATTEPATTRAAGHGGPAGDWLGTLDLGAVKLHIVFHVTRAGDGTMSGTLDSIDQGAKGIPLSKVTASGQTVRLECQSVAGVFEGKLAAGGQTIDGTWQQGGAALPLTLKRTTGVVVIVRPQDPKPPYPYTQEEVGFGNRTAGITLSGTLTIPKGAAPHPAVILVAGSGPNNRNEEVFNHRPFLVLADALTRRGVAVLRYDKRGIGKSTGDFRAATLRDFADDVRAAIAYLQSRSDIDRRRIGLLGHSEGGITAPMAAAGSSDVSFLVLLAAPGVRGDKLLATQQADILRSAGADEATIASARDAQQKMFDVIRTEKDEAAAMKQLRQLREQSLATLPEPLRKASESSGEAQARMLLSPWFRQLLDTDPKEALSKLHGPVLALNGEKDLQVSATQNLPAIRAALGSAKNSDVTIRELPGLNHLFQPCTTGSPSEYGTIETTLSPDVLNLIGDWVVAHTR